ncbi:MAG: OmpH family outer membrane protein [Gammaproteobacteria bacterium]|nr:OmpH family outer membrane protein [Gammaproteobacteria bacterium]
MNKRINFRIALATVAAVIIFGLTSAHAEGLKIGYVDMKSALENTSDHQKGMEQLKAMSAKKIKDLTALGEQIRQAEKDLLSQSMAMSPDRLAMKQQELKQMRKVFQRKQQDAQEEIAVEKNRLEMSIGKKFQEALNACGEQGNYDMLLAKPVFLYVDPKHDVTAEITKMLDAK